ncbi:MULTISPECIES: DUF4083 domain-containing protein [unclassified Bacillus (in: firmicutes)]|uniref:DUF4083 domain-containing protein n=1 Tax=unclassified Bacillus (in: firmicutes) TaxID=185979 RepID=UPI0037C02E08
MGSLDFNIGDLVYQLIMFILLLGMIFAVYFFVRSLLARLNKPNNIEQKLDRVIELLEKDKRD